MENLITSGEDLFILIMIFLLFCLAIALVYFIYEVREKTKRLMAEKAGEEFVQVSLWRRFVGTPVAVSEEKSIMLEHDYDGIKELDNHLPPWWTNLFYGSIIFAVVYMLVYHVFDKAPLPAEEYEIAMSKAKAEAKAYQEKMGNNIDENTVTLNLDNADGIANGKVIYDANCMACHGLSGEGTVGPNLTDEYWLHGGSINDIFKTIKYGVPEKGMISWQSLINPSDMQDVSNYIVTLQGSNPPNAKAPEGEIFTPESSDEPTNAETETSEEAE